MNEEHTRASLLLLLEISRELNTTLDLRTILTRVLTLGARYVGAERASIIVLDDQMQPVEAAISYGDNPHPTSFERIGDVLSSGLAGWVARTRQVAWLADTSQDERWLKRPDDAPEQTGPKSAICAPLLATENLVGILTIVHPQKNYFTEEHVGLVRGIADLAALAVRNARLYTSLQTAHRRYRELFEASMDPIFITNWQGGIMDVNRQAERITGEAKASLLQKTISDLFPLRQDRLGQNFVELMGGTSLNFESSLQPRGGAQHPIEVYVRRIDYSGADSLQWILHDISERVELDRMREDLSAMIYHDLRSPLANIVSSLDLLSAMLPQDLDPGVQSVLNIANRSVDRLQRMINSLLDINRLQAGQPITTRRKIIPAQMLQDVADVVKITCESKQQTVRLQLEDDLPPLQADLDMIRRVLINLLENASKFSPDGTELEIGARNSDGLLTFWVKDQGPGIPPESREIIFEKFSRLQGARSTKGLGLGLAFCRLAVLAHGGKIWVESESGQGSTFLFSLPVSQTE